MKTIKVSELEGVALDYFVCKATGLLDAYREAYARPGTFNYYWERQADPDEKQFLRPSTSGDNGVQIIEREGITCAVMMEAYITERGTEVFRRAGWKAWYEPTAFWMRKRYVCEGPTVLVAAMRSYVVCKLGDTVEVPEELIV